MNKWAVNIIGYIQGNERFSEDTMEEMLNTGALKAAIQDTIKTLTVVEIVSKKLDECTTNIDPDKMQKRRKLSRI